MAVGNSPTLAVVPSELARDHARQHDEAATHMGAASRLYSSADLAWGTRKCRWKWALLTGCSQILSTLLIERRNIS